MSFFIGVPLLFVTVTAFPFVCAPYYTVRDSLRGHPQKLHGTHPQNFVGFWIREDFVMNDFVGNAFYLMPDGTFTGIPGMTARQWHFDNNSFFIDSFSRCGNCYEGNITTERTVQFLGSDKLLISNTKEVNRGIVGKYRRVAITDALKSELSRREESDNEGESFKAHSALQAIEQFERMSKSER